MDLLVPTRLCLQAASATRKYYCDALRLVRTQFTIALERARAAMAREHTADTTVEGNAASPSKPRRMCLASAFAKASGGDRSKDYLSVSCVDTFWLFIF